MKHKYQIACDLHVHVCLTSRGWDRQQYQKGTCMKVKLGQPRRKVICMRVKVNQGQGQAVGSSTTGPHNLTLTQTTCTRVPLPMSPTNPPPPGQIQDENSSTSHKFILTCGKIVTLTQMRARSPIFDGRYLEVIHPWNTCMAASSVTKGNRRTELDARKCTRPATVITLTMTQYLHTENLCILQWQERDKCIP